MGQNSKPVVAIALSASMWRNMFRDEDIDRLRTVADIHGPLPEGYVNGQLGQLLEPARVAITGWGTPRIDNELLERLPNLGLIAHSAGSVKHLVNEYTFERGIRVSTAAGANAVPVAQLTVGLMVTLLKQLPWIGEAYRRGDRDEIVRRKAVCRELQDMTIGLVSASRVGREVIKLLAGYPRLTIKLYDPFITETQARTLGVQLARLEDVCRCEVVSIHAPNIPQTRHMFNAQTLALLPDHAVLINTARGAILDEAALVAELNRRPLYVALDVTDPEPPVPDSPLRTAPNVLLTPHIAGAMAQAKHDMGQVAIEETIRFLKGESLWNEITREMLPTQA